MRLIDADELIKELNKKNVVGRFNTIELIDNAPTVDLKDIYQEGHYDGHLEGYTKAINEERPQGEWINKKLMSCGKILKLRADVIECQCLKCKRWCVNWADRMDYEKCPHCGADMRGNNNE